VVQTPKPDTSAPAVKVSTIQKISFTEEQNYTRIQIEGSEPIAPPFYKLLSDPLRIAIDVPNIDLKQIKSPLRIENGTIGDVLTTQYDDKGRIEISLLQMTNYNISNEEKDLIIDVEKVKKVEEAKGVKKEEESLKETKVEAPVTEPKKEESLPTSPPLNKAKRVVNVLFEEKKDFIIFNILADGKIENFNAFKLDSPPRLVLDIWGVDTRKTSFKVKNPLIKGVRIGHYQDKLRLVFDSQKNQLPPYQVNRIDDKLMVSLGNIPQPSEPQIYVQDKSAKESPAAPKAQIESRPKPGKPSTLTSIDFKRMDDKSRIILSLSAEDLQFESSTPSKNMIAIEVKNASAPNRLLKGIDTSVFESVVNYIDLRNIKVGKGNDVRVLVKLGEEAPYETTKEGKEIFVDIKEKTKKTEAKTEVPPPELKKEEAAEVKKEVVKKEDEVKREEKPAPELKKEEMKAAQKTMPPTTVAKKVKVEGEKKVFAEGGPQNVYSGRKLSLDFKDADIKNILRLIAEVSNLNIIVADEVTGKITMRLVDVPWDQALDVILQSKRLDKRQAGNVVRIAPVDALRREDQASLEEQKSKERLEPMVNELIPVNYATAKEIMPQVKSILSERGDVKVDDRTNTLIIKDVSKNIPAAKSLVKFLDRKTPLVLIEARIVEANLAFQRELGVQWGFLVGGGKATAGGGTSGSVLGKTVGRVVDLAANPRSGLGGGGAGAAGILAAVFSKGTIQEIDVTLSAHENQGNAKIISSPKIATLDNKEASVEQGLRIPYLKLTTEGTVTTDFIDANLKLTVTPHVTNDGTIKLILKVKKDAPDLTITVQGVPSIDKKEAICEVLIRDGGVVAIAGVYSIEKNEGAEGVPLFSKIPLLGWLFKRENKEDKRKDLLIFVSPKVLKDEV
ncbi:MAG: type IV pilus secretin PilQ, partial [Desulfobacterales bacterium]|nr:type IV pilus secretin PilQ [Desulfobacterales bacterium]